jgi:hypothetical protein
MYGWWLSMSSAQVHFCGSHQSPIQWSAHTGAEQAVRLSQHTYQLHLQNGQDEAWCVVWPLRSGVSKAPISGQDESY